MAEILACRRGLVTSMRGCGGQPGKLRLDPNFEPLAALVDAPSMRQATNVQFQPSLGGPVYVYVFGDLMGDTTITGTAFAGLCDNPSNSGIKEVIDYYESNRASVRKETITVTYGSNSLTGFLTQMALSPRDPLYMLTSFSLTIRTLPKE
jgi:hypothetical protein